MIQKTARLRMGTAKTRVVGECRAAIKANNIHQLFKCAADLQAQSPNPMHALHDDGSQ